MPIETLEKIETLEEKKVRVANEVAYKFRDESELSEAQLADPDYRLKQIFGDKLGQQICSKCHHCR